MKTSRGVLRPSKLRGQATRDRTIEQCEPAAVKHNASAALISANRERADQRIGIGLCHRHVKLGGNFMRREIGEAHPQGFRCRGSVSKRIANRGELCGAIQPPGVNVGFQHHKPERFG
jgi:hypothetical protein